jgi:hypothetical protein
LLTRPPAEWSGSVSCARKLSSKRARGPGKAFHAGGKAFRPVEAAFRPPNTRTYVLCAGRT